MPVTISDCVIAGTVYASGRLVIDHLRMFDGEIFCDGVAEISRVELTRGRIAAAGGLDLTASRVEGVEQNDWAVPLVRLTGFQGRARVVNCILTDRGGAAEGKAVVEIGPSERARVSGNTIFAWSRWGEADPPTVGVRIKHASTWAGRAVEAVVDANDLRGVGIPIVDESLDATGSTTSAVFNNIVIPDEN